MKKRQSAQKKAIPDLGLLLIVALIFHGVLIPYTISGTYDAYIHMFFGDHYNRSWFDPWEPRWYTGFSTTSYPPATHMIIAAMMNFVSLKGAYTFTMLLGVLTLVLGFYRFTRILAPHAAMISTLLLIFASSIVQTIHVFGQLPTIFSLGVFFNAMPFVFRWLVIGGTKNLIAAVILAGATTAAHHVTTIFGSVFFIGPLAVYGWIIYLRRKRNSQLGFQSPKILIASRPIFRGLILAIAILVIVVFTVYPFWYWSLSDPITQVSIPHGTRGNFLERPELGMAFFIVPWGITLIFLPYIFYKGFTSILWPFAASMFLCLILGIGGTTPLSKMILRDAFYILTLDRFTFWATILALPFMGIIILSILNGEIGSLIVDRYGEGVKNVSLGTIVVGFAIVPIIIGTLGAHKNLQPMPIDPEPIVAFMASDDHDRWRYLTLGFGDQFAYVSALSSALSVDGNYHSARRLPDLNRYSVERLENAKYLGVGGLGSLQQFLANANDYHLKFVFSNDSFYDPLLYALGWNQIARLPNNIAIWEKPNIDPLPFVIPRKNFSEFHKLMWGIAPPLMSILGFFVIAVSGYRLLLPGQIEENIFESARHKQTSTDLRVLLVSVSSITIILGIYFAKLELQRTKNFTSPEGIISRYFWYLNARQYEDAYQLIDPQTRPEYEAYWFSRMWQGGMIFGFGNLQYVNSNLTSTTMTLRNYDVDSRWMTALGMFDYKTEIRTVERDGRWYVVPKNLIPYQTSERVMKRSAAEFHVVGRRQPRPETDLYKDMPDRPEFAAADVALVLHRGRYSLLGIVTNADVDPIDLSLRSELFDIQNEKLISGSAGVVTPFRLLPGETSGFRISFSGNLSFAEAKKYGGFDPSIYIPPIFERPPERAYLSMSSLIGDRGFYRSIMLSDLIFREDIGELVIEGRVHNHGLKTLSTIKVLASLYDERGKLRWVEGTFVNEVLRPGQITNFELRAPKSENIEIVYELDSQNLDINLNLANDTGVVPGVDIGTIPLNSAAGYKSVRLYVDPQVFEEAL